MTASQPQRHVGKAEQVCHDLFSGVMLCAVEYMYLIFMTLSVALSVKELRTEKTLSKGS